MGWDMDQPTGLVQARAQQVRLVEAVLVVGMAEMAGAGHQHTNRHLVGMPMLTCWHQPSRAAAAATRSLTSVLQAVA